MKILTPVVIAALTAYGCSSDSPENSATNGDASTAGEPVPTTHIDRSGLSNVGTAPLDYSDPNLWLCRPGNDPDECLTDLDATEYLKDGATQLDHHVPLQNAPYDCFYVYPTVALGGNGNMTDFSKIDPTLDPLLAQAARFTKLCTVYAPLYRQVSLSLGGSTPAGDASTGDAGGDGGDGGAAVARSGDSALALGDVIAAFDYYVKNLNKGRKFVIMGHSQGTMMLTGVLQQTIDKDDALRAQMISALLIGGAISAPEGKDVGGTFQNIPLCTMPGQVGCVIAYNTFAKEAPPPANTLFGKAPAGSVNACTNPSLLAGNSGRYKGSYSPTSFKNPLFKPDGMLPEAPTPFVMSRDMFRGTCVNANGLSYLEIAVDQTPDDMRTVPPYRNTASESLGFGLHIADYALEQDDLIDAVSQQAKAAGAM